MSGSGMARLELPAASAQTDRPTVPNSIPCREHLLSGVGFGTFHPTLVVDGPLGLGRMSSCSTGCFLAYGSGVFLYILKNYLVPFGPLDCALTHHDALHHPTRKRIF